MKKNGLFAPMAGMIPALGLMLAAAVALAGCDNGGGGSSGGGGGTLPSAPYVPTSAYGISLSQAGTHTFPEVAPGYGTQAPKSVTITNTGNQATGALTASLSGTNADAYFTLSPASISSIAPGGTAAFTVVPKTGLAVDAYTAAVTVSGGNGITAGFNVSFTVTLMPTSPTYGINLDVAGAYTFTAATLGYGTQTPLSVTIGNTGNQATEALALWLSGANSGSFFLSKTAIEDIGVSETAAFTVVPKTGLPTGTYTASVIISGGNGITAGFTISFTVTLAPTAPTYGINLDVSGTHTFPAVAPGYGAQTAKSVNITNTGNQATGFLTAALSGVNASAYFALSSTSISSIASGVTTAFTVTPKTGLTAGTYTATVTVSGGNGIAAGFDVSFTVTGVPVSPTYGINLDIAAAYTFPAAPVGYGAQAPLGVTIANTGNQATGALTLGLSGTDSGSFFLPKTTISNVEAGETAAFTVVPMTGLPTGTYTASVTISGGNGITASFTITFTVNPPPTYGISLSQTGTHTFTAATLGYGAQTAKSITITNTGNQASGLLTAALGGTNSGSFTLSATSLSSIAAGGTGAFTVVPRTGLAVGTYTATVTVSGGNGITAGFDVSFTVSGGDVPAGKIITAWVTEHAIAASASSATVSRSAVSPANRVTITVTGGGYTAYGWTLRGAPQTGETAASYTFDAAWRSTGVYTIGLIVTQGTGSAAVQYSKEFTITVTD